MSDNDTPIGPNATGLDQIDVNSDAALEEWAKKLDASPAQIKEAVGAVGDKASDVEMHLKGSRSSTTADKVD